MEYKQTITITFGDQAENHVGMQKIGQLAEDGFNLKELKKSKKLFESKGYTCELVHLNKKLEEDDAEDAYILIIRDGLNCILEDIDKTSTDMFEEQNDLEVDKKALMYGRVVNKNARHNLCFDKESQEPNYKKGKGRIIAYRDVPITKYLRKQLPKYFGEKASKLTAEGNYYYDIKKCGIGFHGDSERKRVIAVRLGASIPLHYQWFYQGSPVGKRKKLMINHGDLYAMSEKATGFDWKRKTVYTLRHAAGSKKFLTIK